MNALEAARAADVDGRILDAIRTYGPIIGGLSGNLSTEELREVHVNLAGIYFECSDLGFAAEYRIPEDLFQRGAVLSMGVLALCNRRLGEHGLTELWSELVSSIFWGDFREDRWLRLPREYPDIPEITAYCMKCGYLPRDQDFMNQYLASLPEKKTVAQNYLYSIISNPADI